MNGASYTLLAMITTGIASVIVTRLLLNRRSGPKACCAVSAAASKERARRPAR